MKELIITTLMILCFNCHQEQNLYRLEKLADVKTTIDNEIKWLNSLDEEDKYNEYYVIQVEDLLYIANVNSQNIFRFMTFYENITCENIGSERIIFLKSVSPINDVSPYYSKANSPCEVSVNYGQIEAPKYVNGVIYRISNNKEKFNLKLLKRGDIGKEIRKNDKLWFKITIQEEPKK